MGQASVPAAGRRDATLIAPLMTSRFIAAAAVVIDHSGASWVQMVPHAPAMLKTLLLNGYLGVTYFFVLSGFILHFTYRGGVRDAASWKKYGVARFARIYPIYLLSILAMIPFVPLRGASDLPQFMLMQWWLPNHLLHLRNWNMPAWSLSVELFLYLCFPLLSRWIANLGTRWLWAIVAACGAFALISGSAACFSNRLVHYAWMVWVPIPLLRLPEFAIGICAGELHMRRAGKRFPVPSWLLVAAMLVVASLVSAQWIGGFTALVSAGFMLAIASEKGWLARALSLRLLVFLGGASYALYLFHQPVHFAILRVFGGSKLVLLAQYPVLLIVAAVVFVYVEEPVREWIRRRMGMRPSVVEPVAGHPAG